MEFDINRIRTLCDKYFDGETSVDEEMALKAYFKASENVPADLKAVKVMICGMEEAASMAYVPSSSKPSVRLRRIIRVTMAAAASAVIFLTVFNREIYGYDAEGKAITDPQVALRSTECLAMLDRLEATIDIAELLAKEMEDNNFTK